MTITQLEYLIAVEKFGSFSIAANNCFVTQPTLSMQIQKLEEELGVIIFTRNNYPIKPTDIGKKIIEQAKQIIKETQKLQVIIQLEKSEFNGSLHIAVIPTISTYLLPKFLNNFVKRYPNIELIIEEVTTDEVIKGIEKEVFDIGIVALRSFNNNLKTEILYYEPFLAYLPNNHKLLKKKKINQSDLKIKDFLLLKEGHCLRDQVLSICRISEKQLNEKNNKIVFESGNLETLIKLVEQNFGMTLIPYLTTDYLKNSKNRSYIREFNSPIPKREVGIIYSNTFIKVHMINALKEEILKVIPEELKKNKDGIIIR